MPLRRALAAALLTLGLLACGSSTETSSSTASSGGGGASASTGAGGHREPAHHRPAGTPCTEDRPTEGPVDGIDGNLCQDDSECTQGQAGRCVANLGQPSFCSYDACSDDSECGGSSICECRSPATFHANVCVHGGCQIDADCGGGGYCSPSAVTVDPSCAFDIEPGSVGYFCHTAEDDCVDDEDCGGAVGTSVCLFVVGAARWSCHELLCAF